MQTELDVTSTSESAFEREAIPHMRQLFSVALRLTHRPCDAEDLVQETFTRAFVKFDQFTPGTNLGGWLYRVMLTTFYSGCRSRSRRPAETLASEQEYAGGIASPARSAEAEALGDLGDGEAVRALAQLPAVYKSVVYLADIESYRYAEIANFLGIPLGTVMSRVHRGRTLLRSKLSPTHPAEALHTGRPALPSAPRRAARLAA